MFPVSHFDNHIVAKGAEARQGCMDPFGGTVGTSCRGPRCGPAGGGLGPLDEADLDPIGGVDDQLAVGFLGGDPVLGEA